MKFKDRFNRSEIKKMHGLVYVSYVKCRDGLPKSIWLDGDIFWASPYGNHCVTGPAISKIDNYMEYWINGKKVNVFEILLS